VTWIVDLVEGVEQSIQVLARNSRSTVDHINVEVRVPYADVQPDRPVLGVLDGVAQQTAKDHGQEHRVTAREFRGFLDLEN